jgi:FkbM family methyltransferase
MDGLYLMPNGLFARQGTSDVGTWHDVFDFDKGWHLPNKPLENPKVIIDLGAYAGYTAFDFAERYPTARIIAIEPDKSNFALLRMNLHDPKIFALNVAISSNFGMYAMSSEEHNAKRIIPSDTGDVSATTLDYLMQTYKISQIDYIKFDIEGTEKLILKSDGLWWAATKSFKVEVHEGYSVAECREDIEKRGFKTALDPGLDKAVYAWKSS